MKTEILTVDPRQPDPAAIATAARVLQRGGLVAFPTETVYGLGANALDSAAVERIFLAKGRPATNPVIVHVSGAGAARELVADWPIEAQRLAAHFWPGPLTVVLEKRRTVPDRVTAGGATVGLRVPAHPVALALIEAAGIPLAAPSANRSTRLSPTRAEHVLGSLAGRIDVLLDGGPTSGGLESTVVDLTTSPATVLRPGLVSLAQLTAVLGTEPVLSGRPSSEAPLRSPGLIERHYAPRAILECHAERAAERVDELLASGYRVGWLTFDPIAGEDRPGLTVRTIPRDPAAYAAQLYSVLHELDALGVERIVVAMPPETPEWLAVRDRLTRASTRD